MSRWHALETTCAHLRAGLLDGAHAPVAADCPWELVIEASSHHYVSAALGWCLTDAPGTPDEVRGYFEAVLSLNAERNQKIMGQLALVLKILNAIGIEPVLLKGAAHLLDGLYPDPGLRILSDLDILIPAERAGAADAALRDLGFGSTLRGATDPASARHLPPLHRADLPVPVELHTRVDGEASAAALIPTAWFSAGTRAVAIGDGRALLPDATRTIAHAVVHDQLDHGGWQRKSMRVRPLLDFALARARHENSIDWDELKALFARGGAEPALSRYLCYAEVLFGQPLPYVCGEDRAAIVDELVGATEKGTARGHVLARLAAFYGADVRRRPVLVLNLLKPGTWAKRIRFVMRTVKSARW